MFILIFSFTELIVYFYFDSGEKKGDNRQAAAFCCVWKVMGVEDEPA
jgi:hypothetical protein